MTEDTKHSRTPDAAPLGTRLWRAARLRCPACGGGPVMLGWMKPRPRCASCGMRTDRGEHDFFLGAMMFNLALAEGCLTLVLLAVAIAMYPRVPWTFFEYGGPVLMVLAPFIFYPFSRTIWLAFDLLLRPLTPEELHWHHIRPDTEMRGEDFRA